MRMMMHASYTNYPGFTSEQSCLKSTPPNVKYSQVLHLLEGPSAGYRKQVSGFTRAYQVLKSDVMWYFADNYGNKTALHWNTQNCSHVFYNFGQWPLSHAEPQPWQAQHYAQQVHRLAL